MKKGFTLLEMVLVMTVIAVLFLLTVPNIQNVIGSVTSKGCDAQCKVVDTAIVQFMMDNDAQTVTISQLVSDGYLTEKQTTCQNGVPIRIENGVAKAN
ncbi:MAG: prepilin-type N-terminal cleavage/methylation domain-containing protein [Erysipelothrix sp.]|nr:prepilin-type N-terminal cleavage/methylation domain-containing protein [Erysipelothrix sp.]